MRADMDVDAGDARLTSAQRAEALFRLTLAVASGQPTRGEAAGHYQLQTSTRTPLLRPTRTPLPLW